MKFIRHISRLPETWPEPCALRYGNAKTQTSSSQVSIPPEVLARYNSVNAQAQTVAQTPFQQYSNDPNAFVAPLDSTQQAGIVGTDQNANAADPYYVRALGLASQASPYLNTAGATTAMGLGALGSAPWQFQQGSNAMNQGLGALGAAPGMFQQGAGAINTSLGTQNSAAGLVQAGTGAIMPSALTPDAISQYENPYISNVVNPTEALSEQQFQQAQGSQLGNAITSGAFGGDRAGIAAANLQGQQGLGLQQTLGNLESGAYTSGLGVAQQQQGLNLSAEQNTAARQLQGASELSGIGQAQASAGAGLAGIGGQYGTLGGQYGALGSGLAGIGGQYGTLGGQYGGLGAYQAGIGGDYGSLASVFGAMGQGAQGAGLAGAQAQLAAGQTQQGTEQAGLTALYNQFLQQQSYPFQTTQFLGNLAEGTGALSGSSTTGTSPAPFFSDERLKEDIQPIGKTFDGQKIVKFRYKGSPDTRIGLVAQDVEKRHPEAVGLAGGYKTVDYDAATKDAARKGHASGGLAGSMGGEVVPFPQRIRDVTGEIAHVRQRLAYGGLSPNSGWDAGFYVDPSYLQAQEAAYQNAPWGNAGPVGGNAPYGGKSHVPQASPGPSRALAVAPAPKAQPSGIQQLSQGLGQVESLGKAGQGLWNMRPQGGLSPSQPATGGPPAGAAVFNQSSGAGTGHLQEYDAPAPDLSGLPDDFLSRGGLIPRHRDTGGEANDNDYTPYESGTGEKGLNIPNDPPSRLTVAQAPSNSQSGSTDPLGGMGEVVGDAAKIAGLILPFMAQGGLVPRLHRASGGPDMPLPDMTAPDDFNAPPRTPGLAPDLIARPAVEASVNKKVPGLNPDAPAPEAQPVQARGLNPSNAEQVYSTDPNSAPSPVNGGMGGVPDVIANNQGWLVPFLHGLGTMASSNSRYLGSAILQGMGGAADSYENVQNEMQGRALNQPIVQERQIGANTALYQNWLRVNAYRQNQGLPDLSFEDYQRSVSSPNASPSQQPQSGRGLPGTTLPPASPAGQSAAPVAPTAAPGGQFRYTGPELQTATVKRGGIDVPVSQDEAYLRGFVMHNSMMANDPVLGGAVKFAAEQLQNIQGQAPAQRIITGTNGMPMPQPGGAEAARLAALPGIQVKQAQDFMDERTAFNKNYAQADSLLNGMRDLYQHYQAGSPGTEIKPYLSNLSRMIDPSGKTDFFANAGGNYDDAVKLAAMATVGRLSQTVGASSAPRAVLDELSHYSGDPRMQPSALKDIVARGKSALSYSQKMYNEYDYQKNPDLGKYLNDFNTKNDYDKNYYQKERLTEPKFAGEPPPVISDPKDTKYLNSGDKFYTPDGRLKVKP